MDLTLSCVNKKKSFSELQDTFFAVAHFLDYLQETLAHTRENIIGDIEKQIRFVVKKLTLMSWGI